MAFGKEFLSLVCHSLKMKKTILVILLILVVVLGASTRLSVVGWLFLVGIISMAVFGFIHLLVHLRYIKALKDFRWVDYALIAVSHLLYIGIFLFQYDFGDDSGAVVINEILGSFPIYNVSKYHGVYLTVSIISYFICIGCMLIRLKGIDKTFSTKKIGIFGLVILLVIVIPIVTIYGINKVDQIKRKHKEEKAGRYNNLERALRNIPQVKYLRLYQHPDAYTEIPAGVFKLTELEELEMYSNKISAIPPDINKLKKLRILNLQYNQIQEIPSEVFELNQLEELILLNNDLKSLSADVCKCTSLKSIQVSGHHLDSIPFCINNMPNLKELVIQSDSINSLMDDLKYFKNLKKLSIYSYGGPEFDHHKYTELKKELNQTQHNW
jgi:hypothetical protein